jgi:uncharacterized SAM-binding protein YcdF (DUF218 family)
MAVKRSSPDLAQRLQRKKHKNWLVLAIVAFLVAIALKLLFNIAYVRPQNAAQPVDAVFVLGGSIRREIYAAQLAKQYSDLPILISHGSADPCIVKIFQYFGARMNRVWLEKCAHSTFDNFVFGVPIVKSWGARHVTVVTSDSHLPRAKWLAQIHFWSQGIAVDLAIPEETGRPGNNESRVKTLLDVTRSVLWTGVAQLVSVPCWDVIELNQVSLNDWLGRSYRCEYHPQLFRTQSRF